MDKVNNRFYFRGFSLLGIFNTITACLCNLVLVLHRDDTNKVVGWHIDKGTNFPPTLEEPKTGMGYNPPPQDLVLPERPTPTPPKKEGVGELSVVFTLEEPKIEDGIPYGKLGYALLKHLRKQRQESNELG